MSKRNDFILRGALGLAILATASLAAAQNQGELLRAGSADLVPQRTVVTERAALANEERAPLEFFQALEAKSELYASAPHQAESREYWQQVDGEALRTGYALALTAPGAVILISPTVEAQPLLIDQVAITHGGARLEFEQAADTLVDADALRAAGMDVQPGSVGFRLRDGFESDAAVVVDAADGRYVLHVLEPNSEHVLALQAKSDTVHAGHPLQVELAMLGGAGLDTAAAVLVAPDGSRHDLDVAAGREGWSGTIRIPEGIPAQAGLWEVHATAAASDKGRLFQRDARTAVAVVAPTARLAGGYDWHNRRGDGAMVLRFGLEVAVAGRYELRGVLYGTNGKGAQVPLGLAHGAAWLEPGQAQLSLTYPVLDIVGIGGPYELRDLRLSDQTAASLLERREHVLTLR